MRSGIARRMLASGHKPAPTPHPSQRQAARTVSSVLAPVRKVARTVSNGLDSALGLDAADAPLPVSGPGLFVEVYSDVFSGLPIPLKSQVATEFTEAVSPALNYTQDFWDANDNQLGLRPPLFDLADNYTQFTLLFYGARPSIARCGGLSLGLELDRNMHQGDSVPRACRPSPVVTHGRPAHHGPVR